MIAICRKVVEHILAFLSRGRMFAEVFFRPSKMILPCALASIARPLSTSTAPEIDQNPRVVEDFVDQDLGPCVGAVELATSRKTD